MSIRCAITSISWARVHLTMTATFSTHRSKNPEQPSHTDSDVVDHDVQFTIVQGKRSFPVKTDHINGLVYRLSINVTNFQSRGPVPDGTWRLVATIDGEPGPAATYDLTDLERLDQESRVFLFNQNRGSYVVTFGITESDTKPEFLMRTYQMSRIPAVAKRTLRKTVRRAARKVGSRTNRVRAANAWFQIARRLRPPNGTRVLFASESRARIEGNLLRIRDRMVERGLDERFEFRYSFRDPHARTKVGTLRRIFLIATSDFVLIDDYFSMLESLRVSDSTKIIQVWHAGSGFKAIGYSRFGNYGSPRLASAHRSYTYAITGSQHLIPVYAEAFGIEDEAVVATGLPRIDTFLDKERTEKVVSDFFAKYPQFKGKRIILFAPTFRGRSIRQAYYDYSRIDFDKLYETCGEDTVVLFRMHHFVRTPVPIPPQYGDRLFDFADFPDTNDLLHVTDLLITDYSSIIYEFALLERPMLFFAYDKDIYSATRGFHRDFDVTAPGKVCITFDQLLDAIKNDDYDRWKVDAFRRENFDNIDTNSTDRVIDWLILGEREQQ